MYFAQEKTVFLRQLESQSALTVNIPHAPNPEILPKSGNVRRPSILWAGRKFAYGCGVLQIAKRPWQALYIGVNEKRFSVMIIYHSYLFEKTRFLQSLLR